jgi:hypothetical protein
MIIAITFTARLNSCLAPKPSLTHISVFLTHNSFLILFSKTRYYELLNIMWLFNMFNPSFVMLASPVHAQVDRLIPKV